MIDMNQNEDTIIEFRAVKGEDEIAGYMYLSEADDEQPLHFYDKNGFEIGTHLPYQETELYIAFTEDSMLIQFLVDFATENRTFEREGYTLHINEGALMEAEVTRADKEHDQGGYEACYGHIKFKFNGKPLKLDEDYGIELIDKLEDSTQSTVTYKNGCYYAEFPTSFWEDEPEYVDEEEAESILEDFYIDLAREVFVMQLSRDAHLSEYGDTLEQSFENDYVDDLELYELQQAIEDDNVKEFLSSKGYEIETDGGFTVSFDNVSEVLTKTVKVYGNGAMVSIPKKHLGKDVQIVIKKQD